MEEKENTRDRRGKRKLQDAEGSSKTTRKNHDSDEEGSTKRRRDNHYSGAEGSTRGTRKNHHHDDYDADGSTNRTRKNHHDEGLTKGTRKNHESDAEGSTKGTRKNHHNYDAEASREETRKKYHDYDEKSSTRRTRRNNHGHDAKGSTKRTRKNHDSDADASTKGTGKSHDSDGEESTKGTRKNHDSDVSINGTSDDSTNQRHNDRVGGRSRYYDREQRYDSFERVYYCYPLSFVDDEPDMETGNKIIMPEAALMPLMESRITMPMMFEIQNNSTGKVSHCGVLQFTGMETEAIFLPEWMMKNLQLELGDSVTLRNTSLAKGTKIKLQPHTMDFLAIKDPKAVLESNLRNFCCLTTGDSIMITHESKGFYINVLETEPGHAICITDTDCEVDFAPPLDYKEPEKRTDKKESVTEQPKFQPFKRQLNREPSTQGVEEKEKQKFVPFMGKSNQLGGGVWKLEECSKHPKFEGLDEESSTVWPEEQEKQTKQVKFIPFSGSSRRLDGELSVSASSIPMTDKQPTPVAGGISMAVKPMFKPFTGLSRRLDDA